MPKTAVVILHYNNDLMTDQCVDLVQKTTKPSEVYIIVVDNHSDTVYVRPDVDVIRNDNKYAVSGMNFGFYHALYNLPFKADYIMNLDNDILCQTGWLEPLISV